MRLRAGGSREEGRIQGYLRNFHPDLFPDQTKAMQVKILTSSSAHCSYADDRYNMASRVHDELRLKRRGGGYSR
jgi:hypothetical protein